MDSKLSSSKIRWQIDISPGSLVTYTHKNHDLGVFMVKVRIESSNYCFALLHCVNGAYNIAEWKFAKATKAMQNINKKSQKNETF